MRKSIISIATTFTLVICSYSQSHPQYLIDGIYTADPSAHKFNNKIYIYPSHDIEPETKNGEAGGHYDMKDYHVYSKQTLEDEVIDHGIALSIEDVPWASRQMWAPDIAEKNGKFYFYFPAKDKNGLFKIGIALGDKPEGPFIAEKNPIIGSYSIDPAVFKDNENDYYMYFGGLRGGQLQWYRNNLLIGCGEEPQGDEPALCPKVVKLSDNMLEFSESPKDLVIVDSTGTPISAKNHEIRFFEGIWVHKYNGVYYITYSTGNTHNLCYATGNNPYGPFTFRGILMTPVKGWTTHASIIEIDGQWFIFYHDTKQSGVNYLRNVKYRPITYKADGTIELMDGLE